MWRIDAAIGALIADGLFCLVFMARILTGTAELGFGDYFALLVIIGVLFAACFVIYHEHWAEHGDVVSNVKKLRIKELEKGASVEFDGRRYRVDSINHNKGEILLQGIGQPGNILVQIEGRG
jgi:hypothetical protein